MKRLVQKLKAYLGEVGASDARIVPVAGGSRRLPVFMSKRYETHRMLLFGNAYYLLVCRGAPPSPAEAAKHAKRARSTLDGSVAFLFAALPAFERRRLIQRCVPFIVPQRQIYLPTALLDLRGPAGAGAGIVPEDRNVLSAPAQAILLFHLQRPNAGDWPLSRWAQILGYSPATLTRVRREMEDADLCRIKGAGRARLLHFSGDRRALWQKALPRLRTPVRSRACVSIANASRLPLLEAGLTALSGETMIAPGSTPVYATHSSSFRTALEEDKIRRSVVGEDDAVVIERWRYAPVPLSGDGRRVDRLSLYLSLADDHDERVQAARGDMLENMAW